MFKKILIANRGEIAVRVERTCRDLGIQTIALYDKSDMRSLHVRLADRCVRLPSERGYLDQQAILQIAHDTGAEAIYPGYGFLAERPEFIQACEDAGLAFVGPPADVVAATQDKLAALGRARAAGFATPEYAPRAFGKDDLDALRNAATQLGYPVMIKSAVGGRGRGARPVHEPEQLEKAFHQAVAGAQAVFGDERVYLEQAIIPAHYVETQVLGDRQGQLVYLGERYNSLLRSNQKIITETPSPYLSQEQRADLQHKAIAIARLFGCRSACSVDFMIDQGGQAYFIEIKARIQVEHAVTEMVTQVDIVREQLRVAAGELLSFEQDDVAFQGCAIQCRINAEDPWNDFLPSPGQVETFRVPGGPHVRFDTYAASGTEIPLSYDPIFAKLTVWGEDRSACLRRVQRALSECFITGIRTNIPLLHRVLSDPTFAERAFTTELSRQALPDAPVTEKNRRDLAIAAAIAYAAHGDPTYASQPDRLRSGWHQDGRQGWR
jgi:acetyl/propionyl-CoA carboxylase alpha subunit